MRNGIIASEARRGAPPVGPSPTLIDFTGTDGSAYPTDFTTVGASGTVINEIRSNQGYMESTTTNARMGKFWTAATASADVIYTYDISMPTQKGEVFMFTIMDDGASVAGTMEPQNGYVVAITPASSATTASFYTTKRVAGGSSQSLSSLFNQTFTAGLIYRFKIEHNSAGLLRWKLWDTAGAEPGSWRFTTTDTSITTPGKSRHGMSGTGAIGSFDNASYTLTA